MFGFFNVGFRAYGSGLGVRKGSNRASEEVQEDEERNRSHDCRGKTRTVWCVIVLLDLKKKRYNS